VESDILHYTITGAQDWPMFKLMFGVVAGLCGAMWVIITALIGIMWRDLRTRIASQRHDDKAHCVDCKSNHTREFDSIWTKLDECCHKVGIATGS